MIIKIQENNILLLPKEIVEKLNLTEGDLLDINIDDNKIILNPIDIFNDETIDALNESKDMNDKTKYKRYKAFKDVLDDVH